MIISYNDSRELLDQFNVTQQDKYFIYRIDRILKLMVERSDSSEMLNGAQLRMKKDGTGFKIVFLIGTKGNEVQIDFKMNEFEEAFNAVRDLAIVKGHITFAEVPQ